MVTQSQEPNQDTRQRLMEAALLAFADKGFDGVGVREIARKAKANPALIAYHFGSKEGLYEASLKWFAVDFFQWIQNIPSVPDKNAPNAKAVALLGLNTFINGLFDQLIASGHKKYQMSELLQKAAHKLWSQEMADPRTGLVDLFLEQVRKTADHIMACASILRPDISGLELEAVVASIQGPIFFFYRSFNFIQTLRGGAFTKDDLKKLSQYFTDFSMRGLGIPDVFFNEGA
ncbi:MAG: TetR family transcriptional regulator [Holophagaceae bacterium]|nr:TetR family transcriptional regulator [Holophagaceae bacterium]